MRAMASKLDIFLIALHASLSGVRPYGVSLLVCGWDSTRGPMLYQVDPSGSFWAWKASAIGKNMINAKTFLEKRYASYVLFIRDCSDATAGITMTLVWRMRSTQRS